MGAITISRQLGSRGLDVANATARLLSFDLVYRELINQAALLAGAPETALAAIDDLGLLGISPPLKARKAYLHAVSTVMYDLAAKGNIVIVGRAGQSILHNAPGVLHVRIIAPEAIRARRVAESRGISLETAQAHIAASDHNRQNYLKRYYGIRWNDPELYHLTINTEYLHPSAAAHIIAQAFHQLSSVVNPVYPQQERPFEPIPED
jgi:cytidylate kinase